MDNQPQNQPPKPEQDSTYQPPVTPESPDSTNQVQQPPLASSESNPQPVLAALPASASPEKSKTGLVVIIVVAVFVVVAGAILLVSSL